MALAFTAGVAPQSAPVLGRSSQSQAARPGLRDQGNGTAGTACICLGAAAVAFAAKRSESSTSCRAAAVKKKGVKVVHGNLDLDVLLFD